MYDIHLHKHKTVHFSPRKKQMGKAEERQTEFKISAQPNVFICTPYKPSQLVLSWLTLWIISHLLMSHMQMSKVLIMFGKQLS